MKRSLSFVISLIVLTSMLLAACGTLPAATPTAVPPTAVPTNTAPPTTTPLPTATATPSCPPAGNAAIPFPTGGKTITVGFSQEPDLVDALFNSMNYMSSGLWIDQVVQVGLGAWDANNNLVPELATEIPSTANGGISSDGLTITWHLKPCLFWSDGQPLTSGDVKFTWSLLTNPVNKVASHSGYDEISSIDTPDDTTVLLHFKDLYPGWQTLFDSGYYSYGNIQPEHILKGKTGLLKDPFIHWPTVSSGPWVISEWVAGDHMTLLPNPNYWKGHPKLDQIQIKFFSNTTSEKAALQARKVDFVPDFFETDLTNLHALEPTIHTRVVSGPEVEHYFFNLGVKSTGTGQSDYDGFCPFKDVNVRKAIILGIDRQTIIKKLLFGLTTVPASMWPNSDWTNTNLTPYPYDIKQAASLLDLAGYKPGPGGIRHGICNGVDTKLSFNFETTTRTLRKNLAFLVQSNLKQIGIEFKPIFTNANTFFGDYASGANMATGNFDMAGFVTGFYPDPYTDNFLCSSVISAQNPGGDNNYHLCDPALDALFQQSNASVDPAIRKGFFNQIQQYMFDNALIIPMYSSDMNIIAYLDRFVLPPIGVLGGMMGDSFDWDVKK